MKISILTPSYNSVDFIERAIASVNIQSYKNWEHIVVDGGSKDGTVDILKKYPDIKWISEEDQGQSDAMNKAFDMCTGDIIVYLNSDDIFYEGAFQAVIDAFEKHPDKDIVVGKLMVAINGEEYVFDQSIVSTKWKEIIYLEKRYPQNPVCYFYKKCVQEKVGEFPHNEHYAMDFWFLLRAFYYFDSVMIDKVLGCFIHGEDNKTNNLPNGFEIKRKVVRDFLKKYAPLKLIPASKSFLLDKRNNSNYSLKTKKVLSMVGLYKFK